MSVPVAIYTRVSKESQENDRQLSDLKHVADSHGWRVTECISEKITGASNLTGSTARKGIARLMTLASEGKIHKVLVTEVSRLGRRTSEVLQAIETLTDLGVSVYVHTYSLETLTPKGKRNPTASLLFTLLAEFARVERETLIERIHSGLQEARRKGKKLGRPKGSQKSTEAFFKKHRTVVECLRKGYSIRHAAKVAGVSPATVQKCKHLLTTT